jgi:hypothetical protein
MMRVSLDQYPLPPSALGDHADDIDTPVTGSCCSLAWTTAIGIMGRPPTGWNTLRDHLILDYKFWKIDVDLRTRILHAPIDEMTLERKIETLLDSFASQRPRSWFDVETFRAPARSRGLECGSPTRFAEGAHARKVVFA